jgi:small-conductance mechanosensitive channel
MLASYPVLASCMLGLMLVRRQPARIRFAVDAISLAAISAVLWNGGDSPLLLSRPAVANLNDAWLRFVAIAWWFFACRAAVSMLRASTGHDKRSRETRLFSDLLAAGIYVAAAVIVLDALFKVPVGGLLATSGLLAIVVGLALQNTLGDVFAGIAVGVERPFGVGDRVRLSDGIEGRVEQMNWRSIRLRTDQDDLAVIPNSTIAKAEIVNRSSPTERGTVRADLTAPSDADPDRVFDLLRAAALLTPDALSDPPPTTLLLRVGERTSSYAIIFTVSDTARSPRARSELLRHARKQMATTGMVPGTSAECGGRLLREATVFESLSEDQFSRLEDALRLRHLVAGQTMFEQGSEEPVLYLVAGGVIEVSRLTDGKREVLGHIGAGEYIGEIGLLTGSAKTVSTVALTDVRVFTLDKSAIDPLLADSEDLLMAFERSVRRGQDLLSRSPAAARSDEIGGPGELIARIRRFFRRS